MGKKGTIQQVERLHKIHRILTTRDKVTATDLQWALKLNSTKTVHRDIQLMRDYGAVIRWDPSKKTYHYVRPTYTLPSLDLYEEDQIFSLMMATEILREFKYTHMATYMEAIRDHLLEGLEDARVREYQLIKEKFSYMPAPVARIDPGIWEVVSEGLRHNRFLKIHYQKPTGEKSERKIAPLHLRGFQGRWYLIAYCYQNGEIRVFNMARIREVKHHRDGTFNPKLSRFRFDLATYFPSASQIFVSEDTYCCKILFSSRVAGRVKEVTWYENQVVHEVGIGQETHIEDQCGFRGKAVGEAEGDDVDDETSGTRKDLSLIAHDLPELVDIHVAGVQHPVGEGTDPREAAPFLGDPVLNRSVGSQGVWAPGLGESPWPGRFAASDLPKSARPWGRLPSRTGRATPAG